MQLSKQFTTFTTLSKYLALSFFIILPMITFAIGYHTGKLSSIRKVSTSTLSGSTPTPVPTLKFTHEFIIRELGMKIKVPKEIADELIYKHENNAVYFSTKSITKADPLCGPSDGPLGVLVKVYKNSPRSEIAKNLTQLRIDEGYSDTVMYPRAKEFENYYIEYAGPQALCSTSSQARNLISSTHYFFDIGGILASMEPIK